MAILDDLRHTITQAIRQMPAPTIFSRIQISDAPDHRGRAGLTILLRNDKTLARHIAQTPAYQFPLEMYTSMTVMYNHIAHLIEDSLQPFPSELWAAARLHAQAPGIMERFGVGLTSDKKHIMVPGQSFAPLAILQEAGDAQEATNARRNLGLWGQWLLQCFWPEQGPATSSTLTTPLLRIWYIMDDLFGQTTKKQYEQAIHCAVGTNMVWCLGQNEIDQEVARLQDLLASAKIIFPS